jgi:creatinine amidohydrolase
VQPDPVELARRFKHTDVVVLPPVPYGFSAGTGMHLPVRKGLFVRVLRAIARGLVSQGFRRVFFLAGKGSLSAVSGSGLPVLRAPAAREEPTAGPLELDLAERVVVVSTGHTEQHGHHLPLGTDTYIAQAIADGIRAAAPDRADCLPVWPYGVSTHTSQYPGTLNLGGRVFEDFLLAVTAELIGRGARAIYFSNAHGGNHSFLVNVVKWAGERWPKAFIATEWLHTTGPALEQLRESAIGGMGHGCELETSYLLHLRPDLVRMERATVETDFIRTPNYYMDWIEGGRLIANPPWSDDTRSGIYGDPRRASGRKGKAWLEAAVREKLEVIDEILEQVRRRATRRSDAAWGSTTAV